MGMRWALAGIVVCGLAACSSGSSTSGTSTSGSSSGGSSTSVIPAPAVSPASSTTAAGGVQNLPVTTAVRQSLLDAGAAHQSLPTSDYTGLRAGATYYAYDAGTSTYWAGAALDPSPSSEQAQVSSQDDGSYLLFRMPSGGAWTVYDDGLGGVGGTPCPVTIPPGVIAAWGWSVGTCAPPNR
jgi:hypothetical protein